MVPICGVCHASDSKYKCPTCELRYCSIACYKSHQQQHHAPAIPNESSQGTPSSSTLPPGSLNPSTTLPTPSSSSPLPRPTASASSNPNPIKATPSRLTSGKTPPSLPFSSLATDPLFQRLLTRYPRLPAQLQLIYGLTLEPGPGDAARGWNRAVRWDAPAATAAAAAAAAATASSSSNPTAWPSTSTENTDLNAAGSGTPTAAMRRGRPDFARNSRFASGFRGQGGRGGRGGGRGAGVGYARGAAEQLEDAALRGPWTREKGDKLGLGVLRRMRTRTANGAGGGPGMDDGEGNEKELVEGMDEFVQLCQMRFGASRE